MMAFLAIAGNAVWGQSSYDAEIEIKGITTSKWTDEDNKDVDSYSVNKGADNNNVVTIKKDGSFLIKDSGDDRNDKSNVQIKFAEGVTEVSITLNGVKTNAYLDNDLTASKEENPDVPGTGVLSAYNGLSFTFGTSTWPKREVEYSIGQDENGNKYLALDKGLDDPVMTPSFPGFERYSSFSFSMDLAQHPDYINDVAEYRIRIRTSAEKNPSADQRTETTVFALRNNGEIVVAGVGTGVFLKADGFTSVAVSVDLTTGRYAEVSVWIDGVPYQGGRLDVQSTVMYKNDPTLDTWEKVRTNAGTFAFRSWTDHNKVDGSGTHAGLLFDNIYTYSGRISDARMVTYHVNNGVMAGSAVRFYKLDEFPELPQPTRDGAVFLGWYTSADLSGDEVTSFTPNDPRREVHLYAKWELQEGLISYHLNGGTADLGSLPVSFTVGEGAVISLPDPVRENATFAGWYLTPDFSGERITDDYVITEDFDRDVAFYAKFIGESVTLDFEDAEPGPVTSLPHFTLSSADQKPGVSYTVMEDDDGKYLRWVKGSLDSQLRMHLPVSDFLIGGSKAISFSIDLRQDQTNPGLGGTLWLRQESDWQDAVAFGYVDADGKVYLGGNNRGSLVGELSAEEFRTFTFVIDFETMTINGYLNGERTAGQTFTLPEVTEKTPESWLRTVTFFNWSAFEWGEADSSIHVDNIRGAETDLVMTDGYLISLFEDGEVSYARADGAYTLPEGYWLDESGKLVSGEISVTAPVALRKLSVVLQTGASIRLDDPAGLRFESALDSTLYNALTAAGYTVKFGTYIFPADQYTDGVPADAVFSTFTDVAQLTEQDGIYTYYTSLVNLLPRNYARSFGAISYVTAEKDGKSSTFRTEFRLADHARSVYEVAKQVAAAGELEKMTESQRQTVTGYLDRVVEIVGGTAVTINGYISPYEVTVDAEQNLTVRGDVGLVTAVIADGIVYTRGWQINEEQTELTAVLPSVAE